MTHHAPLRARASRAAAAALLACVAAVLPAWVPAGAQGLRAGGACTLEFYPRDASNPPATNAIRLPGSDNYNVYVGGGAQYRCQGQDVTLSADSTEYIESASVLYLIGNVRYREPRVRVDAARMTYFQADDRLVAEGGVQATTPSGTTMRGPRVEYFRAVPSRPRTRMIATGRPETTLVQKDSAGNAQEPVTIVSDRIVTEADTFVYAGGKVDITRTDLVARGDSAFLDSGREFARLMRNPSIDSRPRRPGDRTFALVGTTIELFSRQRQVERVVALGAGKATSTDLVLTADTIDLRVADRKMERAFAWGTSRARATSPSREITADSLEVYMPGQRMREVRAIRDAMAQTDPDTTRIRSGERDWISGDTVVARFDTAASTVAGTAAGTAAARAPGAPSGTVVASAPAPDSAGQPRIREVVASGHARSYYQIASADAGPFRPGVNYVLGREITLRFAARPPLAPVVRDGAGGPPAATPDGAQSDVQQQLETVTVVDHAAGLYLEPNDDTTGARRRAAEAAPRGDATTPAARPGARPASTRPTPARPTPRTTTPRTTTPRTTSPVRRPGS